MCGFAAAGLIITAVSAAASFQQAQQQAKFQRQQAQNQAIRIEDEVQSVENARVLREEDRRERQRRVIADQKVAFGAQGSLIDSNITAATAFEFAKEQFNDNLDVERRTNDLLANATNTRLSGESAASASEAKGNQALLSIGSSAASFGAGGGFGDGSLFSSTGADTTSTAFLNGNISQAGTGQF